MPMDAFLADVPLNKVMVFANYRSSFTNVMAIRNNPQGRRAVYDWLAITMSGYIQCHGFDQAAIAALLANRIAKDTKFTKSNPLGFSCTYSKEGNTVRIFFSHLFLSVPNFHF